MKKYELMIILKSSLGDTGAKDACEGLKKVITDLGGSVTSENFWGKRKLAYEMEHEKDGYYNVIQLEIDPSLLEKLKEKLRFMDSALRYLVTTL